MENKGFTLIELLAVIVILALVMTIAIFNIGGIFQGASQNTFKESGVSIIEAVKKHLIINNELNDGYYGFSPKLLERGLEESPLGGNIQYHDGSGTQIGTSPVYKLDSIPACMSTTPSYVRVSYNSSKHAYTYNICLTAGLDEYYIDDAELSDLLDSNNMDMIVNNTPGYISLSSYSGELNSYNYTYARVISGRCSASTISKGASISFDVIDKSGNQLNCKSSNTSYATCDITNGTVKVTRVLENTSSANVTITVTSARTDQYSTAKAYYNLALNKTETHGKYNGAAPAESSCTPGYISTKIETAASSCKNTTTTVGIGLRLCFYSP